MSLIAEALSTPVLRVNGRVVVDLLDDRGKTVERVEGDNYINQAMWERYARFAQKATFLNQLAPAGGGVITPTAFQRDPRMPPALFNDTICCWNDQTAEDTADKWAFGEPIAWAHKFGQGALSTRQGLSNGALHEISENALKWVWEWTTSNGNGTFQSVGWRRIGWSATTGDAIIRDFPNYSKRVISWNNSVLSSNTPAETIVGLAVRRGAWYFDVTSSRLYCIGLTSSTTAKAVYWPVTFTNGCVELGTQVDASADPIFDDLAIAGDGVLSTNTRMTNGMCRLGAAGDWIGVGNTATSTSRRPWVRRVTTGGSVTYTNVNVGTFPSESWLHDATYDGVNVYAVGGLAAGNVRRIYRIDPADGSVSATIAVSGLPSMYSSFTSDSATNMFTGIEWDSANGWFWVTTYDGYLFNVDSSGVWLGVMMNHTIPPNQNLVAPTTSGLTALYASEQSQYSFGAHADIDGYSIPNGPTSSSSLAVGMPTQAFDGNTVAGVASASVGMRLITMNGHVWNQGTIVSTSTGGNSAAFAGWNNFTELPNFFSRSRLASPVTKTSANSMRVAYEMSFS